MKSNLAQEPSNDKSDFLIGDVVVYMDHVEINNLKVVEVFQPTEFYWLEGGQIVHRSDIRQATIAEIKANRRLTDVEQSKAEVS